MARNTILLISLVIVAILTPFIVCSLYYGFQDTSCANMAVTKFSISFDLGTWLKVDGFTDLVFTSVLLLAGIGSICDLQIIQSATACGFVTTVIVCIFKGIWMIIGAILYWGDIGQTGMCGSAIAAYTSARIVLGLILPILIPLFMVCMVFLGLSPRVFA